MRLAQTLLCLSCHHARLCWLNVAVCAAFCKQSSCCLWQCDTPWLNSTLSVCLCGEQWPADTTHFNTTQSKKAALQVSWTVTIWLSLVCQSMCCKQSSLTASIIRRIKMAVLCIDLLIVIMLVSLIYCWGVGMCCFESTFLICVVRPRAAHMPGQAMSSSASSVNVLMCTMIGINTVFYAIFCWLFVYSRPVYSPSFQRHASFHYC